MFRLLPLIAIGQVETAVSLIRGHKVVLFCRSEKGARMITYTQRAFADRFTL